MKIVSIETFTNEYVGLVRLRTDEGDEGWGQTSTYNSEITAQVLHLQVAPHVLGMSGHDISEVNREVLEREQLVDEEPEQLSHYYRLKFAPNLRHPHQFLIELIQRIR